MTTMLRTNDWPEKLAEYLAACLCDASEFEVYGSLAFALGALTAQTGEEVSALTGADLTTLFGDPAPASMARRGEIVSADDESGLVYGVCDGFEAVFISPFGLERIPLVDCCESWGSF